MSRGRKSKPVILTDKEREYLEDRIYTYFNEVNEEPVVFHWKYNLSDIDISEEIIVDRLLFKKSC